MAERLSRRQMLAIGGAGAAGLAAAGVAGAMLRGAADEPPTELNDPSAAVPFYGTRQAGIITPAQDRLHFVAFDVVTTKREELIRLLQAWTEAAARMTAGRDAGPVGAVAGIPEAPPDDTGEAIGLPPAQLTLTIGFGASLFRDAEGRDRFGLADRVPEALAPLPRFPNDAIEPAISHGDICVQACANDPQVAVHAIRNLARIGFGVVSVRWSQLGYGRTSSTSTEQQTARNLMGFKDGTANLKAEQTAELDRHLWVGSGDGPSWMDGGSYLVTRKIRMMIETWDRTSLVEQETIIGRTKGEGAVFGQVKEFDEPDFTIRHGDGELVVPEDSHIRLAHRDFNGGARMLRRGYNFVDGSDGLGRLNAGLFFISYQRNAHRQFVPVQRQLATKDVLNEYIRHVSSGLFACPGGVRDATDHWGRALFA
jgi:deferrochelatase/peroxidase EfeB